MDKLAAALGIDPVELRLLNALEPGDTLPTGQVDRPARCRSREVIRRAAALAVPEPEELPRDPIRLPGRRRATRRAARASGAASASRSASRTSATRRASTTSAPRACVLARGRHAPRCTAPRPRSARASIDVILQVARTELGTDDVALAPHTTATRRLGRLGVGVAHDVDGRRRRARRVPRGARGARARRRRRGRRRARLPPPAHDAARPRDGPDHGRARARRASPCAAMRVVVEVDVELGLTRVVWIGTAQDVGKAINPQRGRGPDRGRHRAGPRARADGGDPDARRP